MKKSKKKLEPFILINNPYDEEPQAFASYLPKAIENGFLFLECKGKSSAFVEEEHWQLKVPIEELKKLIDFYNSNETNSFVLKNWGLSYNNFNWESFRISYSIVIETAKGTFTVNSGRYVNFDKPIKSQAAALLLRWIKNLS